MDAAAHPCVQGAGRGIHRHASRWQRREREPGFGTGTAPVPGEPTQKGVASGATAGLVWGCGAGTRATTRPGASRVTSRLCAVIVGLIHFCLRLRIACVCNHKFHLLSLTIARASPQSPPCRGLRSCTMALSSCWSVTAIRSPSCRCVYVSVIEVTRECDCVCMC
jgi:hypothetical protein